MRGWALLFVLYVVVWCLCIAFFVVGGVCVWGVCVDVNVLGLVAFVLAFYACRVVSRLIVGTFTLLGLRMIMMMHCLIWLIGRVTLVLDICGPAAVYIQRLCVRTAIVTSTRTCHY